MNLKFFYTCLIIARSECDKYTINTANTTNSTDGYCHSSIYNETNVSCPITGFWPYFFSIQYFIFLKLILMTLLYALFASTASKLMTDTDSIWKFQRYILVVDFANRLPLPAPLNIFCYIYFVLRFIFRFITCYYCCRKKDQTVSYLLFSLSFHEFDYHFCIFFFSSLKGWKK
jgi:hypothetical protein